MNCCFGNENDNAVVQNRKRLPDLARNLFGGLALSGPTPNCLSTPTSENRRPTGPALSPSEIGPGKDRLNATMASLAIIAKRA